MIAQFIKIQTEQDKMIKSQKQKVTLHT